MKRIKWQIWVAVVIGVMIGAGDELPQRVSGLVWMLGVGILVFAYYSSAPKE
jgi:hypothetical protein